MKGNSKGFTLVEISIVMVIVGLLLAMGAGMIGPLTTRAKTTETRDNLDAAVQAVIGFASIRGRLPTAAEFTSVVPFVNDSWGGQLQYIYASNLVDPTDLTRTVLRSANSTNLLVKECKDIACAVPSIQNVAFIILSRGGNYNNQTWSGAAIAIPQTINTYPPGWPVDDCILVKNCPAASPPTIPLDPSQNDAYDDMVKWVTLGELQTKSGQRCTAYEVYTNNPASPSLQSFQVNGGGCIAISSADTPISSIGPGGVIKGWNNNDCDSTPPAVSSMRRYSDIITAVPPSGDIDGNCQVHWDLSDR